MRARWLPILLTAAMSMPGRGQSQLQNRFALTTGQVARALSGGGMPTVDRQVSMLARVVATEPDPALDILSVEALGKAQAAGHTPLRSRVELACHVAGKCLPFFVIVSWSEPPPGPATATSTGSSLTRNLMFNPRSQVTMRAGTRATLMMDDHRSHIQVAVISLENGMAGQSIRVSSMDHKQVYFGEVVSPSLLKGSF